MIACCPGAKALCALPFQHHGVQVHHFYENRLQNRVLNKMLGRGAFTYGSLVRLIDRIQPQVLHFHNRQELVDALISRLNYRPKVAIHYHRHFAKPVIPSAADLLFFISDATARDILGKASTDKPYRVLPNPLSVELLSHSIGAVKKSASSPPTILFGGGNNPAKGGQELIEAFNLLPAGSARLVLAGRKSEQMTHEPNEAIEVHGELTPERFFQLMADADIVAMPSYDEPFGLIAQEAMQLEKLFVTTATGGLAEFVDDRCAILVKPRDVGSLCAGLKRAIKILDTPEAKQLTQSARERISTFDPTSLVELLEAHYEALSPKVRT
jgi:glycosyltransferase involved in cell wall biosynthesis